MPRAYFGHEKPAIERLPIPARAANPRLGNGPIDRFRVAASYLQVAIIFSVIF